MPDLDLEAARAAKTVAGQTSLEEKLNNAASSVLAENGPYALFLFLYSETVDRNRRLDLQKPAGRILEGCLGLLNEHVSLGCDLRRISNHQQVMGRVISMSSDLNRLLLARKLLTQYLTYLRYWAKVSEGHN